MSLIKAVTTIGGFTLISRVFGFIREMMMAAYLGAGASSDAFFIAFKLPNFLRRLFAEGAFNAAFVPLFAGRLEQEGEASAREFAEEIFSVLTVILLGIVVVAEIFMPALVLAFAASYAQDAEKFALTVLLSRICFPYILFISLLTLYGGILNSMQRFAAAAASPIIMNLCMIAALWLAPSEALSAHWLSFGVLAAGITQFLWMAISCYRAGILPQWRRPRFSPDVRKLLKIAIPAAFGASIAQVNLLIDSQFAATIENAVSWLYYGDRLNELVIGVIGVAIGTALLPLLTRTIKAGQEAEALHKLNQASFLCLALAVPAACGLFVLAKPLILTLYEHGAFTREDTEAVYPTLMAYSAGLPAFVMIKILNTGFYARHDTLTPVKIGLFCIAVNLLCNFMLMYFYGHVGLAMSSAISGWTNTLLMGWILHRRGHFRPDKLLWRRVLGIFSASLLMAAALAWLFPQLAWEKMADRVSHLAILIAVGGGVYGFSVLALRVIKPSDIALLKGRRP
jgi:putative peptidoglycan lipid II flippase